MRPAARAGVARAPLVGVVDEDECGGHPRCGAGQEAGGKVEGGLGHRAEPEADARAYDCLLYTSDAADE